MFTFLQRKVFAKNENVTYGWVSLGGGISSDGSGSTQSKKHHKISLA